MSSLRLHRGLVLVGFAAACSCSSSASPSSPAAIAPLDCAWAPSNNCWKTTAAAARDCVPGDEIGVFSSDLRSCSFPSGKLVRFGQAVRFPAGANSSWDFTVQAAGASGASCMHIVEVTDLRMTTSAGDVHAFQQQGTYEVDCPDGSRFAGQSWDLTRCADTENLPALVVSTSGPSLTIALQGAVGKTPMHLFTCNR